MSAQGLDHPAEVDAVLLSEVDAWQVLLARHAARRNPGLSERELNAGVQRIIEGVIFLRLCEDRGLAPGDGLRGLMIGPDVFRRLTTLLGRAEKRFGVGRPHAPSETGRSDQPGGRSPSFTLDDSPLQRILRNVGDPAGPFGVRPLPVDVLGRVYERLLARTIRLGGRRGVRIERRPKSRRTGGIYYTPAFVVEYIVARTLGTILEGKTPRQASRLRVLDPACGCGSFPLGAYRHLLDWHRDWYVEDDAARWAAGRTPRIRLAAGGDWHLTRRERRRILNNAIRGVDMDPAAVDIARRSLILTAEEDAVDRLQSVFDLGRSILCGNALAGPDAIDWRSAFPAIFKGRNGGFDVIIGNPPYVKEYTHRQPFRDLRGTRLETYYQGKMDLWQVFACLSIDLLKRGGLHSFIVPNNWTTAAGASRLREKVLAETCLLEVVDFGRHRVFETAGVQTMIYLLEKRGRPHTGKTRYRRLTGSAAGRDDLERFLPSRETDGPGAAIDATVHVAKRGAAFTFVSDREARVLEHLREVANYRLGGGDVGTGIDVHQDFVRQRHLPILSRPGVKPGDGIFVLSDAERKRLRLGRNERSILKPYYTTAELHRYWGNPRSRYRVIYTDGATVARIDEYPRLKAHLDAMAPVITSDNGPYGLHRARDERLFVGERIVSLRKTRRPQFTYVDFPCYVSQTFFVIKPADIDLKVLAGILNSSLCHFWLDRMGKRQGDLLQVDKAPLLEIPIRRPDPDDPSDAALRTRLIGAVDAAINTQRRLFRTRTAAERPRLQRQAGAVDRRIDRLVYRLYRLSDDDVRVINEAAAP